MQHPSLPPEALLDLRRRLANLPPRSGDRRVLMQETAVLYGVSESSLYRALRERARPKALNRSDRGIPRVLPQTELERYCEVIAALKIRTSNKKGRHLSRGLGLHPRPGRAVQRPAGGDSLLPPRPAGPRPDAGTARSTAGGRPTGVTPIGR